MYCSQCGDTLKEGAPFCPSCGTAVPTSDTNRRRTLFSILAAAALVLLVVGTSLLAFRLASVPSRDTPMGTLSVLIDAFVQRDGIAAANCVELNSERDLILDWMLDADGPEQLLYRLASSHDDGSNDIQDIYRLLDGFTALELVTVVNDWRNAYSNAHSLSALLRVTPSDGVPYTITLPSLDFTYQDGFWYLK